MESRNNRKLVFLCFFAYAVSYIGRLAYSTNIQNLISTYGITKTEAGYVSSAFFFCYGAGQILNGLICGKLNAKKLITFSLFGSSLITLFMFFVQNVAAMSVMWGLNGILLSTLWTNVVSVASHATDEGYLKKAPVVLSVSLPVGTVLAYCMSTLLTYFGIWKVYYLIAAAVVAVGSVFFYFSLTNAEKALGIDASAVVTAKKADGEPLPEKQSLMGYFGLLILPIFLLLVFSAIIKDGIVTWLPTYLTESYNLPAYFSIFVTLLVPLLGITATIFGKWLMQKTNNYYISSGITLVPTTAFLLLMVAGGKLPVVFPIVMFALMSTMVHTINGILTAILPLYSKKEYANSGKLAGILNGFAYVGSVISSVALGNIVDGYGWNAFVVALLVCAVLSFACCVFAFVWQNHKKKARGRT